MFRGMQSPQLVEVVERMVVLMAAETRKGPTCNVDWIIGLCSSLDILHSVVTGKHARGPQETFHWVETMLHGRPGEAAARHLQHAGFIIRALRG